MTFAFDNGAIIVDTGTFTTRYGVSSESSTAQVLPTGLAITADGFQVLEDNELDRLHDVARPMKDSQISDWESLEFLWSTIIDKEVRVSAEELPLFITDPPTSSRQSRIRIAEIVLENFNSPGVVIERTAPLSLFNSGRVNGVVVDCGYSGSNSCVVIEGLVMKDSARRTTVGGRVLTNRTREMLIASGHNLHDPEDGIATARDYKEKFAYLSRNYKRDWEKPGDSRRGIDYRLPDGTHIIHDPRNQFVPAETLFDPKLDAEFSNDGWVRSLPDIVEESLRARDELHPEHIAGDYVLTGGSGQLKNLDLRLEREMRTRLGHDIEVTAPTSRKGFGAFTGATVLCALSSFNTMVISKDTYMEEGDRAIHTN